MRFFSLAQGWDHRQRHG